MRLLLIVAASFSLHLAIHHIPALQQLFGIEPVSPLQCAAWMGLGLMPLLALELRKVLRQDRRAREPAGRSLV